MWDIHVVFVCFSHVYEVLFNFDNMTCLSGVKTSCVIVYILSIYLYQILQNNVGTLCVQHKLGLNTQNSKEMITTLVFSSSGNVSGKSPRRCDHELLAIGTSALEYSRKLH